MKGEKEKKTGVARTRWHTLHRWGLYRSIRLTLLHPVGDGPGDPNNKTQQCRLHTQEGSRLERGRNRLGRMTYYARRRKRGYPPPAVALVP